MKGGALMMLTSCRGQCSRHAGQRAAMRAGSDHHHQRQQVRRSVEQMIIAGDSRQFAATVPAPAPHRTDSAAARHRRGLQRAKITSATAIKSLSARNSFRPDSGKIKRQVGSADRREARADHRCDHALAANRNSHGTRRLGRIAHRQHSQSPARILQARSAARTPLRSPGRTAG